VTRAGQGHGTRSKLGRVPESPYPWAAASATGVGSLPGLDPVQAMRLVFGELPDLPHLAELPARGPGADLTGRTAALLVGLPVETTPSGWRFTAKAGRDVSRARSLLSADLDALEEIASGYQGPLKIQVCGPWTLAATIELARSQDPALADRGAVADVIESLAEGVRAHVADVRQRVQGARLVLQLDEPSLPAVIAGRVPTASGLNRLAAPEAATAEDGIRNVISAAQTVSVVHCCAMSVPFGIIKGSGADGVGIDLSLLRRDEEDALAEAVEAGLGIFAGVIPATPAAGQVPEAASLTGREAASLAGRVTALWGRMGWPTGKGGGDDAAGPGGVAGQVVLTPACGLAGATPGYAKLALARCREAARLLPELAEEARR
jgi:hypothetical protein